MPWLQVVTLKFESPLLAEGLQSIASQSLDGGEQFRLSSVKAPTAGTSSTYAENGPWQELAAVRPLGQGTLSCNLYALGAAQATN